MREVCTTADSVYPGNLLSIICNIFFKTDQEIRYSITGDLKISEEA